MKLTIISVFIAITLIGGAIALSGNNKSASTNNIPANNVTLSQGKQIIEIDVKGGYNPTKSFAKAGMPTVLRFITNGTFDCSSSIRIPSLNVTKILPQTGNTDIDVGTPQLGILSGTCGMGMYRFQIDFQS